MSFRTQTHELLSYEVCYKSCVYIPLFGKQGGICLSAGGKFDFQNWVCLKIKNSLKQ